MALLVSLNIPPDMTMPVPVIPEDATPDQAAAIQAEIAAAVQHNAGVTYPASYARILYVRTLPSDSYIFVCWYADEAARQAGADPVKVYEYQAPTAVLSGDIYPAAYSWIKTLPEFAGAVDC
jgi:hypothetical protein